MYRSCANLTVPLVEILPLSREQSRKSGTQMVKGQSGLESGTQSEAQSGAQSGAQSERILFALSDCPLSSHEISLVLDLETKSGALKRSLK